MNTKYVLFVVKCKWKSCAAMTQFDLDPQNSSTLKSDFNPVVKSRGNDLMCNSHSTHKQELAFSSILFCRQGATLFSLARITFASPIYRYRYTDRRTCTCVLYKFASSLLASVLFIVCHETVWIATIEWSVTGCDVPSSQDGCHDNYSRVYDL